MSSHPRRFQLGSTHSSCWMRSALPSLQLTLSLHLSVAYLRWASLFVLQLVDVKTRDSTVLQGHSAIVMCLAATADGCLLVSGSKDNTARVWQPDEAGAWSCVAIARGHAGDVTAVAVRRKGSSAYFVTGSTDCTVKLWQLPEVLDLEVGHALLLRVCRGSDCKRLLFSLPAN